MTETQYPIAILRTKLHRPTLAEGLVERPRLDELLDGVLSRPLALISGPAGYGKSVLVSHWVETQKLPCAWLSLDESDSDPIGFLSYLVAAVRTQFPEACRETGSFLKTSAATLPEAIIATLSNEVDAIDSPFVLVLDDYHRIAASSAVHELLRRLLDHPPRSLHLVVVSRRDPPLRLEALRAGGHLAEVRLGDLQFTPAESAALLEQLTGRKPGKEVLSTLELRIEGWAVGLHLIGMALSRAEDPGKLVREIAAGVAGSQEYLLSQVLASLSAEMREWLLATSILERFCAPLCEAVCASPDSARRPALDGRGFLDALRKDNLFCIQLDGEGEWFRYHHLFQDGLKKELKRLHDAGEIRALHSRASDWLESQGLIEEAIRQALAGEDRDRAAQLVERHRIAAMNEDRWYVVERWLSLLPGPADLRQAELLLAHAWRYAFGLRLEPLPALLDRVEAILDDSPSSVPHLAEASYFRSFVAFWSGDGASALEYSGHALEGIAADHQLLRGEAELIFALASQMEGQRREALGWLDEQLADPQATHAVRLTRLLAARVFLHIIAGDLERAKASNRLFRQAVERSGYTNAGAWCSYLEGLISFWRNDLAGALPHFHRAVEVKYELETPAAVDSMAGLALTYQALERPTEAAAALEQLFQYAQTKTDTVCLRIAEFCSRRLAVFRGGLTPSLDLSADPPEPEPMLFWLVVPAIAHCRLLLAEGSAESLDLAHARLRRCLELNERLNNTRQTIEILPLLALVREKQGRRGAGLALLERAVILAAPGGWVRPFLEPGSQVAELLRLLSPGPSEAEFVRQLIAASGLGGPAHTRSDEQREEADLEAAQAALGPDALTDREYEILALLLDRLQNKEIAAKLVISTHTVNDHLKHIFRKLAVSNRRQAVVRARELGILRG